MGAAFHKQILDNLDRLSIQSVFYAKIKPGLACKPEYTSDAYRIILEVLFLLLQVRQEKAYVGTKFIESWLKPYMESLWDPFHISILDYHGIIREHDVRDILLYHAKNPSLLNFSIGETEDIETYWPENKLVYERNPLCKGGPRFSRHIWRRFTQDSGEEPLLDPQEGS